VITEAIRHSLGSDYVEITGDYCMFVKLNYIRRYIFNFRLSVANL